MKQRVHRSGPAFALLGLLVGLLVGLLPGVLCGCMTRRENAPIQADAPDAGYRLARSTPGIGNSDALFVVLAFSGGGTRAAALSYGVLEQLRNTRIPAPDGGPDVRLLDEVDWISANSGGSFTAAYYGLFRDDLFTTFGPRFLERNMLRELIFEGLRPANLISSVSSTFGRIDVAANFYDETIFRGRTFADLRRAGARPFIEIQATDLDSGTRFPFTQDQFDLIGSDLGAYPVSYAVAASASVPGIFQPITLRNHPTRPRSGLPDSVRDGLVSTDRSRAHWARTQARYQQDQPDHPYVHLVDGAVSDNTGLEPVIEAYERGFIHRLIAAGRIRRLLVVAVNAMSGARSDIDRSAEVPGTLEAVRRSSAMMVDVATRKTVQRAQALLRPDPAAPGIPRYFVEVNLRQNPNESDRAALLDTPTSLSLAPERVAGLARAGGAILDASPVFRAFLEDVRGGVRARIRGTTRRANAATGAPAVGHGVSELPPPVVRVVTRPRR